MPPDGEENSLGLLVVRCQVEPKYGKAPVHDMNLSNEKSKVDKGTSTKQQKAACDLVKHKNVSARSKPDRRRAKQNQYTTGQRVWIA
jgi:hypothetical protein